jgi:hypothetical protein
MNTNASRSEVKEIIISACGGAALCATLAYLKLIIQKKTSIDLRVETPNLAKKDHALTVFLSELNRQYYALDPVACNRIALFAEDMVNIRLKQSQCPLEMYKEQGFQIYKLYKQQMRRIMQLKQDNNTKAIIQKIDTHFQSHLASIMAG